MNYDIFSKRGKNPPEVYVYDELPTPLRNKIILMWNEIENSVVFEPYDLSDAVVRILRMEYGTIQLPHANRADDPHSELRAFFSMERDIDRLLDAIEVSLRVISDWALRDSDMRPWRTETVAAIVSGVNDRLKEHGVGYGFVEGFIIRKDSEYVHKEIVIPALRLLQKRQLDGVNDEFRQAHKHYRKGDHKAALNECLKSLESVMKSICDQRGWDYPKNSTASRLIDACLENRLIPTYWQSHFRALGSLLKSGIPTGRNHLSGHGQGKEPTSVPAYIVRFMLHQTASVIVFLVDADESR